MWGLTDRSEPCCDLKQTNSPTQVDNKAMLRFSRYHCRNNILGTAQISFPRKDQMLNRPTSPEMTSKPKEEKRIYRNVVPQERLRNTEVSFSHYQARVYLHMKQADTSERYSNRQLSQVPSTSYSSRGQFDTGELRQGRRRVGKEYVYVEQKKPQHQEMIPTPREAKGSPRQTKLTPIQEGAREAAVSLSRQLKTLNEDQCPVVRPVIVRRHEKQEARVERNSHPKRRDGISEGTDATRKDRTFARVLRKRFWLLSVQTKPSRSKESKLIVKFHIVTKQQALQTDLLIGLYQ